MTADELLKHSHVITLAKRRDRLDGFYKRFLYSTGYEAVISNGYVVISYGYDGSKLPIPIKWETSEGAFGACLAHVMTWARALSDEEYNDDTPLLFFEDDAVFCDGFKEGLDFALKVLPNDWEIFYLGGEYLIGKPLPRLVATNGWTSVLKANNVNRLHGYAVKARALRKMFLRLLEYLVNAPKTTGSSGDETCFDYEIGRMIEEGNLIAYAISPFIVGQGAFGSDTYPTSDATKVRYWN